MMKRFDLYKTGDISFEEYCIMMSVPHDFLVPATSHPPRLLLCHDLCGTCHLPPSTSTLAPIFVLSTQISASHRQHSKWAPEPMLTQDGNNLLLSKLDAGTPVHQSLNAMGRTISTDSEPDARRLSKDSGDGEGSRRGSIVAGDSIARELRETFMALDLNSSGFVDPANIKEVMSRLGTTLSGCAISVARPLAKVNRSGVRVRQSGINR